MRYLIGILVISLLSFSSCQSPESKAVEKAKQDSLAKIEARGKYMAAIEEAEKQMKASKTMDQRLAVAALKAYNDFTVTFPEDSMTAEFLFRAAGLAQGSRNYEQSAVFLETIIAKHKGYAKYAETNFMAANLYDSFLENVNHGGDRATQLYQFVIDNYPNTQMAEDSKVLIKYIGQPDSVMFNDILNKAKK